MLRGLGKNYTPTTKLATKLDVIVVITPQHTALKQRSKSSIYHKIKHSNTPLN
jgi:hypothetical protein